MLHAVLLLPLGGPRAAAELVQVLRVPLAHRHRAACGAQGVWPRPRRFGGGPRLGQQRGDALPGHPGATEGHGAPERGRAGEAGLAGCDDRHGLARGEGIIMSADPLVNQAVASLDGTAALPRKNGELVFEAPWQGRVFGLAVSLSDREHYVWDEFRDQ